MDKVCSLSYVAQEGVVGFTLYILRHGLWFRMDTNLPHVTLGLDSMLDICIYLGAYHITAIGVHRCGL